MLDLGIDLSVWPWIWLSIAVIFALVELILVGGSFIVLPFSASAFVSAILAFYDVSIEIQWSVFLFGGAVLFVIMYQWAKKFMRDHPATPGVGADRLVGMVGTVTAAIAPDDIDRRGRVTVEGEIWSALVDGEEPIPAGARVKVIAMKGTRVIVVPQLSGHPPDGKE